MVRGHNVSVASSSSMPIMEEVPIGIRLAQPNTNADTNKTAVPRFMILSATNDQLTDGGPSVTPELPDGVAGPPFGGAPGSALLISLQIASKRSKYSR